MAPQKLKYFMTGQSINVSNGTGATRPTQTVFPKVSVGKTFKLSKLPAEIQDMIFKELLVMPGSILITTHIYAVDTAAHLIRTLPFVNTGLKPTQRTPLHLKIYGKTVIIQEDVVSIFLASKAINHWTVPIYFKSNTFFFKNFDLLQSFADKGNGSHLGKIERVVVVWEGKAPARGAKELLKFTGLRELTLSIEFLSLAGTISADPYEPKLWGMKKLLKIRGLKKLEIEFPQTLKCFHKRCPDIVKSGATNLAGEPNVTAFKRRMEVLKEPRK